MVNGTSRIFTDKVKGLALVGVGLVGVAFLGLRRRGPSQPPTPPPVDPGITLIQVNPLPTEIQDGESVEFQIVVEGGTGALGGDFNFGDGAVVSFGPTDIVEVRPGVFNLILNHRYDLGLTETRDVNTLLQIQDESTGIFNTALAIVRVNPLPIVVPPPGPPPPPVAIIQDFTQSVGSGTSPLVVGYSVTPSDPRSQIIWDFGDGTSLVLNQTQLSHLYSGQGTINGSVQVINSSGESDIRNFSVTLQAPIPPPPGAEDIITSFFQGAAVVNEDSFVSFSISLGVVQRLIRWNFGDGTAEILNQLSVDHQYRTAGSFDGFVEVQSESGMVERRNFSVTVNPSVLNPTNRIDLLFSGSLNVGEQFSARSNPGGGTPPFVNYDWDLGDGFRSSGSDKMTITHAYAQAGTFTIICTVTDSAGQTATATRSVSVTVSPLQFGDATVTITPDGAGADLRISIKNNRNDRRIDGRFRIAIFQSNNQLDTRTVFPTIQPGQTLTEFYAFPNFLPTGVSLRAFAEIKENSTSRLLDDDFFSFVIEPTAPPPVTCEANFSNARSLATSLVNGTFDGTFPSFYATSAQFFLDGLITTQVFIDGWNNLLGRDLIVCNSSI